VPKPLNDGAECVAWVSVLSHTYTGIELSTDICFMQTKLRSILLLTVHYRGSENSMGYPSNTRITIDYTQHTQAAASWRNKERLDSVSKYFRILRSTKNYRQTLASRHKDVWGSRGKTTCILNLDTRRSRVISFMLRPFYHHGNSKWYQRNSKWRAPEKQMQC